MCWKGSTQQRKVADKDIEVYKVMYKYQDKYLPYYKYSEFHYEPGTLYTQELIPLSISFYSPDLCDIKIGFHSYSHKSTIPMITNSNCIRISTPRGTLIAEYRGYSSETMDIYPTWYCGKIEVNREIHIVMCVIPQGATYYENGQGEIVSNRIVVTGEEIPLLNK